MSPPGATAAARRRSPAARVPRGGSLAPRAPRRVSGPALPARVPAGAPLAARLAGVVRRAPDHALTHRLARGRVWIAVLAVALSGIVYMQVTLLRMHASIGQSVERSSALERSNASLRREIAARAGDDRVLSAAVRMGFIQPAAGTPRFLVAGRGDASRAASALARGGSAGGTGLAAPSADSTAMAAQPQADGTAPPPAVEAPAPDQATSPAAGAGTDTAAPGAATNVSPSSSDTAPAPAAATPAAAGGGATAGGQ